MAAGMFVVLSAPVSGYAAQAAQTGETLYKNNCSMCHGDSMEGNPPAIPSLVGVTQRLSSQQITDRVHHGGGAMPAFTQLTDAQIAEIQRYLASSAPPSAPAAPAAPAAPPASPAPSTDSAALVQAGSSLFQQNCSFCHGRDAGGGETGPDLTRSKLVASDSGGDKISQVVRNGRPDKGMPSFNFSDQDLAGLVAFIHSQAAKASAQQGSRRGVDVSDLQTGNVEAGKAYFNGAGKCSTCHSPTGDLAGVASRYEGLHLEEQMLYPHDAKSKVTVTLPSGQTVTGTLAYLDEFTVGLRDSTGTYRSWSIPTVKYSVDAPVEAHADQLSKYTDDDIHNLMAYLQTLR
ncbi:c-type cytochrome [Acidipila sp. 4G-K13]|nr:c-type cytochrome [Paracidobacterium acidisoli]